MFGRCYCVVTVLGCCYGNFTLFYGVARVMLWCCYSVVMLLEWC